MKLMVVISLVISIIGFIILISGVCVEKNLIVYIGLGIGAFGHFLSLPGRLFVDDKK